MNAQDVRQFEVEINDDLHELSQDPVADPQPIRDKISAFLRRVEAEIGEEGNG